MVDAPIIKGIYAITPEEANVETLITQVEACLKGGVNLIQYRSKSLTKKDKYRQAERLKQLCDQYNKPLIINDDIKLCRHLDAFGVHLGKDDDKIENARELLGPNKIVGISCYNDWHRIKMAATAQADYIALGACFSTSTKPHAPKVSLEMIASVIKKYEIPIVVIGGITLENVPLLLEQGVKSIALVNGLFKQQNIEMTARLFNQLLKER